MNATTTEESSIAQNYLADARAELATALTTIEHCASQLNEDQVWWRPSASMNSVGNLLLHLCGNLRSKFRAVIGGLADDRDRASEFSERGPIPTAELLGRLEEVVGAAHGSLADLTPAQLLENRRYRMLRGETESTVQALILQTLLHLSGHTQEIIAYTRLQLGEAYQFRSPQSSPTPDAKTIAADDVVFAGGMLPDHAPAPRIEGQTITTAAISRMADAPEASPLKNYILDLEQEFQDQNEEGKVQP